ncbi:MAG: Response regulator of zinc sigma-54-dependent two-component system [Myxococcaceae bacterium]|nr:Response regulator of zinc sigma-54-dependent two-component system [Myxococcaceae bacterium]
MDPRPAPGAAEGSAHVLIVDDDASVRALVRRVVRERGYVVSEASAVADALEALESQPIDVVVSDLEMGELTGVDLLLAMRRRRMDQPLILLTGHPSVESAAAAVEHGAFRYLMKPFVPAALGRSILDAVRARALTRARDPLGAREDLDRRLRGALREAWIAVQPIVATDTRQTSGYECLLRSRSAEFPHAGLIIEAAEKLGALHDLGRQVRAMIAKVIELLPGDAPFYVNLHPSDLVDADLFDPGAPLTAVARRVVFELTERSPLEGIERLEEKLAGLRAMGGRIAVDDLGAGYSGLSYFAAVRPDIIKLDMSLVRGVDRDALKQRVVRSMTDLARSLDIEIVGEGVETVAERDALVDAGCTHLQGYLFARPAAPFPAAAWGPA